MKNQFEKHIQDAMQGHELPVSNSVWTSIQKKQSKKRPIILFVSRISVACIILLVGLFTFNMFNQEREPMEAIVISHKKVSLFSINQDLDKDLQQVYAAIPEEEIIKPSLNVKRKVLPEQPGHIYIPQQEVIVLNIKARKNNKYQTRIISNPAPTTQVDAEVLLTQIEENLSKQNKKELKSYLTDIKRLASKNSINNKIQTAQNWITKTASDFGLKPKKNKNND